jgi:hypothetical protein
MSGNSVSRFASRTVPLANMTEFNLRVRGSKALILGKDLPGGKSTDAQVITEFPFRPRNMMKIIVKAEENTVRQRIHHRQMDHTVWRQRPPRWAFQRRCGSTYVNPTKTSQ